MNAKNLGEFHGENACEIHGNRTDEDIRKLRDMK